MAFRQLARSFSTSSNLHKLVQCPLKVYGVEGRYASALYSAGVKSSQLEAVEKDVKKIHGAMQDARFKEFLSSPIMQRAEKVQAVQRIMEKLQCNELTKNAFLLMAENGRLSLSSEVCHTFLNIMGAHRGEVPCVITTAKPLDKTLEKDLQQTLQSFLQKGEKLQITMAVDPSLIGGMTVSIGDRFVDMSIATKVRQYTAAIKQAV